MRSIKLALLALLVAGAASCGGSSGELKGSICSVYDCGYDTVTIREVSGGAMTTVQIDFTTGPVNETVERAAVVVCDVSNFVKGEPVPASNVRRVGAVGDDFPPYTKGTCTFDTDLVLGAHVSGSFQSTFTTDLGTERALYGSFEGTLLETSI